MTESSELDNQGCEQRVKVLVIRASRRADVSVYGIQYTGGTMFTDISTVGLRAWPIKGKQFPFMMFHICII